MEAVYAIGLTPLIIATVAWVVVTGLHRTDAALMCAVTHHIAGVFALMVFGTMTPQFASFWLAMFFIGLVTIVWYWYFQIRYYDVRCFRDWLATNHVPIEMLGSREHHPHNRAICANYPHDHDEWEPRES